MDGTYECLLLHPHPLGDPVGVVLSRGGQLAVLVGDEIHAVSRDPWPHLGRGEPSVSALADSALTVLERVTQDRRHLVEPPMAGRGIADLHVVRLLAELARVSALYGAACAIDSAQSWTQSNESVVAPSPATAENTSVFRAGLARFARAAELVAAGELDAGEIWLVWGIEDVPFAAVSAGFVEFSNGKWLDFADLAEEIRLRPWQYVQEIFGPRLRRTVSAGPADPVTRPGLGLPAVLAAFDRNRRALLAAASSGALDDGQAHGPSLGIAKWWARELGEAAGWPVPARAWMAGDYPIAALRAALAWAAGRTWPGGRAVSSDEQLDDVADVVLAWAVAEGPTRILLVDADSTSSFAQTTAKLRRIADVLAEAEKHGVDVEARVVFAAPGRPAGPAVAGWPEFARDERGRARWVPQPATGLRLGIEQASSTPAGWRITGPS